VLLPNIFEKRNPVPVGHVVIANDTVDIVAEALGSLARARSCFDGEPFVFSFEKAGNDIGEVRFVVDVENMNRGFDRINHKYTLNADPEYNGLALNISNEYEIGVLPT